MSFIKRLAGFVVIAPIVALAIVTYNVWQDDGSTSFLASSGDSDDVLVGTIVLPDDGDESIISEIDAARASIRLHLYLLSDQETIDALVRAQTRGVDVRVILEEVPFGGAGTEEEVFGLLESSGIDVRWGNPSFRFTHIKAMVLDEKLVLVMNLNLTESAYSTNREFAVITNDRRSVEQTIAIFEADWNRGPEPPDGPLIVSPTTSRHTLLQLIDSAAESIDVYAEVMTDSEIADALASAVRRGVRVRLVMSETADELLLRKLPGVLAQSGVEVRIRNSIYIHAKALIIDEHTVWLGSQNFTPTSLDRNRELGIVITSPEGVARVMHAFETDFIAGELLLDDQIAAIGTEYAFWA